MGQVSLEDIGLGENIELRSNPVLTLLQASWIIPGPIVTIFVTGFVFYMYGPAWAAGLFAVLVTVDVFAFYMNA